MLQYVWHLHDIGKIKQKQIKKRTPDKSRHKRTKEVAGDFKSNPLAILNSQRIEALRSQLRCVTTVTGDLVVILRAFCDLKLLDPVALWNLSDEGFAIWGI